MPTSQALERTTVHVPIPSCEPPSERPSEHEHARAHAHANPHPLIEAIDLISLHTLADELNVSYQAIRKWQAAGRMPRTEWTGETFYCRTIDRLTGGKVTRDMLLAAWPEWSPQRRPRGQPAQIARPLERLTPLAAAHRGMRAVERHVRTSRGA